MLEKTKIKSGIKRKNVQKKQNLLHQPCFHSWEEKQVGCCKKFVCRSCGKMWMDRNPPFETGLRTKLFRETYGENKVDKLSIIKDQILNQKLIKKLALQNNGTNINEGRKQYSFFRDPNGLYLPIYHLGIEDQFPSSSVSAFKNGVRSTVTAGGVMMMGGGVPAAPVGGPDVYYYSYGGSATSYTTCDDAPSTDYHNGGLVVVATGGTATSFGLKLNIGSVQSCNICLYNSDGTSRLGYCTVSTTDGGDQWVECTSQSIEVSSSSTYLILMSSASASATSCRCSGGADCAEGDGKYTTDDYNINPAIGCPSSVTGLDALTGKAIGVRIYVD